MKRYIFNTIILLFMGMTVMTGCKKWLDVNYDPATPQDPDPASVFPTQLAGIPRGIQYDARYVGRYIQNWETGLVSRTSDILWDQMGYVGSSDANGDIWRQCYFGLGKNLDYIIETGRRKGQWDYVGAAYALKAYMFQTTTDYHGEIIFTEAFKENTAIFKFDSQDTVYMGVRAFCDSAILYLARTDFNTANNRLSRGDYSFNGDNAKWIKFTYGVLARNYQHLSRKSTLYDPAKVIEYCDKSMTTIQDDLLIPFDGTKNEDTNFFGPYRDNLTFIRQSGFIVRLLEGTALAGAKTYENRDPRIKHMLSASQDTAYAGNGGYLGVEPGIGDPNFSNTVVANMRRRSAAPWGDSVYANPSINVFTPNAGKYLFKDKAIMPVMTAAEIYFIKAEAALLMQNELLALDAYTKGINAHFDFINRSTMPRTSTQMYNGNPITTQERTAYLNSANVVRVSANLTLTDIMLQKYIALWGWGFTETWVDLRRYEYNKVLDPKTNLPVYRTFALPQSLNGLNQGFPVQRARPRFNSEYVWNMDELKRIQADLSNYHTKPIWFAIPN